MSDGTTVRRFITGYMSGSTNNVRSWNYGYTLMSGNLNESTSGVTVGAFYVCAR